MRERSFHLEFYAQTTEQNYFQRFKVSKLLPLFLSQELLEDMLHQNKGSNMYKKSCDPKIEDPKRKIVIRITKIETQNNFSAGLRRNHFGLGQGYESLLDQCLQEKTNGTNLLPHVVDHFEKDFTVLSDKLVISPMKIKLMEKGSEY